MKCQKNYLKNTGRNFECLYKRLIINNIVKNINERLSDYSGVRPTMWVGKLVQKNVIKQMIKADLGVTQALFDFKLNTFFYREAK